LPLMLRAEPFGLVNVSLMRSVEPCLTTIGCGVALYPSFVRDIAKPSQMVSQGC
jgi:hypothetical protein